MLEGAATSEREGTHAAKSRPRQLHESEAMQAKRLKFHQVEKRGQSNSSQSSTKLAQGPGMPASLPHNPLRQSRRQVHQGEISVLPRPVILNSGYT